MRGHTPSVVPTDDGDERAELRTLVRQIVAREATPERIRALDEAEDFDYDLYRALGEAGLIGLEADTEGTERADPRSQVVVLEELGAGPTSMAVCLVVQYMGVHLLASHGSEAQRKQILGPLLEGRTRVAFAMTEPDGGTDVARVMRTKAAQRDDRSWVINGVKTWISGAATADHAIVVARTAPPEPSAVDGITLFLVPLEARGVEVHELPTMAIHGLDTCEVLLQDVTVDPGSVLGEVGRGFRQVLATLNGERLNAAAAALGIARGAYEAGLDYARERQAFGRPVGAFQTLQHRMVDDAVQIEAARELVRKAARADALGERADLLSAMAKLAASEAATRAVDNGMRVMAGAGLSREYAMQRYFRDARLYTFAPLTDDMIRNYLGERLLGLPRSY
ncbi:acyl-CoA dehydrogenase family protein [Streptomyces sp. NPDC047061]|uniref:acyl-CoA dehydrogenase family protein n=1 Tax=Streptomyces sp. NPDC047061 TaxID=3154605 RepID=UPI0033FBD70B